MPRRIILHAGFHQTGISRLHDTLRDNRVALKSHIALRLRWHLQDVIPATTAYSVDRAPQTLIAVQALFERMLDAVPGMPRRTLIISAEELLGHMPGSDGVQDYAAAPVLLYAYWDMLHRRYPQAELMIHLTTRAADAWLADAYRTLVENSDMAMDFAGFAQQYRSAAALEDMVAEIASRVPCPVHATAFEACRDLPLGTAAPLLGLCDLPPALLSDLTPAPPAAPSMRDDVLHALLSANQNHATPNARRAAKAAILEQARHT